MNNSRPSSIGENVSKASRERSLQKMSRLIRSTSWGVDNTSSPYIFAASLLLFSPLSFPYMVTALGGDSKIAFFANAFLYFVFGIFVVNALRSKFFNYYFCKSNADLFIEELRKYNPIAVHSLDEACGTIKKQDYNGNWVSFAQSIIVAERQALLNA